MADETEGKVGEDIARLSEWAISAKLGEPWAKMLDEMSAEIARPWVTMSADVATRMSDWAMPAMAMISPEMLSSLSKPLMPDVDIAAALKFMQGEALQESLMASIDWQALTGIPSKESLLLDLGLSGGWADALGQIDWQGRMRGQERPLHTRRPEPKPLPAPPQIEIVQRSHPDARAVLTDAIRQGTMTLAEILSELMYHPEAEGMQEVIEVGIFYETNKGRMTQEACAMHFSMSLATYKRKLQHYRALRKGKHI